MGKEALWVMNCGVYSSPLRPASLLSSFSPSCCRDSLPLSPNLEKDARSNGGDGYWTTRKDPQGCGAPSIFFFSLEKGLLFGSPHSNYVL